jgi:hypothetical protein
MRAWRLRHPERSKEIAKKYRTAHPEMGKAWRLRNPERWREINQRHRIKYREKISVSQKKYREAHYDQLRDYMRNYRILNHEHLLANDRKYDAEHPERIGRGGLKRRLNIGPVRHYLNGWFAGSELHHMGHGYAAFVPKKLHRSISHSLINNWNMDELNWDVLEWVVSAQLGEA